jgi:hypothetical protein
MRIFATLSIAVLILLMSGCSPSPSTSNNRQNRNASPKGETSGMSAPDMYPILEYSRNQSSDVLLQHEATNSERQLFKQMDSAVVALDDDADLDRCYEVIIPIGRKAGLSEKESIAFWTRMTFSEFEP